MRSICRSATRGATVYLPARTKTRRTAESSQSLNHAAPAAWKTIIAERKEAIENVAVIGGGIVAQYLVDVQSRLLLFGLDGSPTRPTSPCREQEPSGVISGRRDGAGNIWYSFSSPLMPSTVYVFNPVSKKSEGFDVATPPVDTSLFETKALFATSADSTRVPFFLTAKRNLPLDGNDPTMIYGYGGFSISTLPTYRQDVPAWLERGGVWVTASMRGGAEYGEAWHKAGMLDKKQNVFADFIAVAEQLVKDEYPFARKAGHHGRVERRPSGRRGHGAAAGSFCRRAPGRRRHGHAAVRQIHGRRAVDDRVQVRRQNPAQFPFLIKYSPVQNLSPGRVIRRH